jgi:carbonic anhydrase/acetyltransferase-like protein (isoleucine patch superfamily)
VALLLPFRGKHPRVAPDAFLAPTAVLIGNVAIGPEASVWFGAILRGDDPEHGISVGPRSSIQDNCVIHVGDWQPTLIGADVTVGHGAKFESCTVEDGAVIGMNAVILQQVTVGAGSVVAANAVVLEGTRIPPGSLAAGVPARVREGVQGSAAEYVGRSGLHYVSLSREYLAEGVGGHVTCHRCGGPAMIWDGDAVCSRCGLKQNHGGP